MDTLVWRISLGLFVLSEFWNVYWMWRFVTCLLYMLCWRLFVGHVWVVWILLLCYAMLIGSPSLLQKTSPLTIARSIITGKSHVSWITSVHRILNQSISLGEIFRFDCMLMYLHIFAVHQYIICLYNYLQYIFICVQYAVHIHAGASLSSILCFSITGLPKGPHLDIASHNSVHSYAHFDRFTGGCGEKWTRPSLGFIREGALQGEPQNPVISGGTWGPLGFPSYPFIFGHLCRGPMSLHL